jgi:hypothetical protein
MVIEPRFGQSSVFHLGIAAVLIGDVKTGKWGFIDKQGKMVIEPQFKAIDDFHEGLAAVQVDDGKKTMWGFVRQ